MVWYSIKIEFKVLISAFICYALFDLHLHLKSELLYLVTMCHTELSDALPCLYNGIMRKKGHLPTRIFPSFCIFSLCLIQHLNNNPTPPVSQKYRVLMVFPFWAMFFAVFFLVIMSVSNSTNSHKDRTKRKIEYFII